MPFGIGIWELVILMVAPARVRREAAPRDGTLDRSRDAEFKDAVTGKEEPEKTEPTPPPAPESAAPAAPPTEPERVETERVSR